MYAEVQAPAGLNESNATITGGGNIWPPCTVSTSCTGVGNVPTATLQQRATVLQNGQNYGDLSLLSNYLGVNVQALPAAGTQFTFNLTSTSGAKQYTLPSNSFTTEVVSFSGVPASGPLSSVVGHTVSYTWTLPTTYSIANVNLFADVANGPTNNPASNTCSINSGSLAATATSGSITFPASMSGCGGTGAITNVSVFLEITGANGEVNLVNLSYPY